MSTTVFAIANVQHALQILKEKIPPHLWSETPLPVIAAPGWFLEQVREELGVEPGFEPDTIHGCSVVRKDEIAEPVLIDHDGTAFPILPKWSRPAAEDRQQGQQDGTSEAA